MKIIVWFLIQNDRSVCLTVHIVHLVDIFIQILMFSITFPTDLYFILKSVGVVLIFYIAMNKFQRCDLQLVLSNEFGLELKLKL